jgi:MerR family transcriptional regulator, heat shock protein HspR
MGHLDRDPTRPVYVISVAASIVSAHPRTLRIYEDEGLLCPARTATNIRLYSEEDVRRILWIRHLTQNRGVNLAGVRVLFELEERLGMRILETLFDEANARDEVNAAAEARAAGEATAAQPRAAGEATAAQARAAGEATAAEARAAGEATAAEARAAGEANAISGARTNGSATPAIPEHHQDRPPTADRQPQPVGDSSAGERSAAGYRDQSTTDLRRRQGEPGNGQ